MKKILLAIAAIAVLTRPVVTDDKIDKDLEGRWLQGQISVLEAAPGLWKIIYGHELSLEDPAILIKDRSALSIEGGKLTFKNGEHEKEIKIECDATKNPKAIDLVVDEETKFLGVYELKEGKLHLGIGDGKTRPKGVKYDKSAPGQIFIVFSKVKPPG